MVLTEAPSGDVVTTAPTVVIEVLSTNRTDDLVRKSTEYLGAGVRQYWIVDPRDRVLDVFELAASGWERIAQLSDDAPKPPPRFRRTARLSCRWSASSGEPVSALAGVSDGDAAALK